MADRKDKKAKNGKDNTQASSSSSTTLSRTSSGPPPVGPVPMNLLQATVESEVTRSWNNKPFSKFPIHKDLPRFIRSILVISPTGECLYQPVMAEPQSSAIERLLKSFALTFEPSNVERILAPLAKLPEKVDTESMAQALEAMDDIDNVTSPTLQLLKSCNQGILAPAVVNLQLAFMGTKFMFIDVKWNILVQIFEHHIRVEHRRFEGFSNGAGHFGWTASLLIRRSDMRLLSVKTRIFEYRIPDDTISAEWLQLIKPIYELDTKDSCKVIFAKPWDRLPIAKDLIRFATSTTFLLGTERSAISTNQGEPITHLKDLLLKLCQLSKDEPMCGLIADTFDSEVADYKSGDLNAILKGYLVEILKWSDESILPRFCKFFTQSIIAPLAINLQLGLSGITPIKDGTTWNISISQIPTGFCIRHTKQQMSLERSNPEKCFDFVWQAEFDVDSAVTQIQALRASVVSLQFPLHEQLPKDQVETKVQEMKSLLNVLLH